jgi:hypothetical protein
MQRTATIRYPHSGDFVQMFSTTHQRSARCSCIGTVKTGQVPAERSKIASTDQSLCRVLMLSTFSSALFSSFALR